MTEISRGTDAPDTAKERRPETAEPFHGTQEMPMPDDTPEVAGRSRRGRVITEPGDPGVITPEDDALDTSDPQPKRP